MSMMVNPYRFASVGGNPSAWTTLTFGSSSTAYGMTVYQADQSWTGTLGEVVQIEAYIYSTDTQDATVGLGDGTDGMWATIQFGDGNCVLYRRIGGATAGNASTGGDADHVYTGLKRIDIEFAFAGDTYGSANINNNPVRRTGFSTSSPVLTGDTVRPFIQTSDTALCYARYRRL